MAHLNVSQAMAKGMRNNKSTPVVFFDIASAFASVHRVLFCLTAKRLAKPGAMH